ncbi:helix-turn-helix protein [Kitasatospora atroaurantiaca]|uniref:Helix-turn-helix protein n=1 Tax=Kitasatospora atroaurantiaca TaxID=285545 RepID=A0A561ER29_9ACTN|nr:helix-turn-helix protein [Kitasatospora atroaurantiaca]
MWVNGPVAKRDGEREVGDVATLKALADPLRLAILNVLMKSAPEPLTVKEMAAELGEPQTKLYRHVKQLEKADLIVVAETRLVSGIVESRYRTGHTSLRLSREIFSDDSADRPAALGTMLAAMDMVRTDFQGHYLGRRIDFAAPVDGSSGPPGLFSHFGMRLTPERLLRLRTQLGAILDQLADEGDSTEEDAVDVTLFTLLYAIKPTAAPDRA